MRGRLLVVDDPEEESNGSVDEEGLSKEREMSAAESWMLGDRRRAWSMWTEEDDDDDDEGLGWP